jgi:hypothetical protein
MDVTSDNAERADMAIVRVGLDVVKQWLAPGWGSTQAMPPPSVSGQ